MRPSDHFYTELDKIAKRVKTTPSSTSALKEEAERAFVRMTAPVIGEDAASELFRWWNERYGSSESPNFEALGNIASFIIGEYDDSTMKLDAEDWEAIRDTVSAEAENMNLDELTRLMADLVSRGALG